MRHLRHLRFCLAILTCSAAAHAFATVGVNDAPVLDASKSPALMPMAANAAAPVGAVGSLVSSLVDYATPNGQVDNVTDLDVSEGEASSIGIAITGADASNGTWWYSTTNGASWLALGSPANSVARLLAADANTRVYYLPGAYFTGTITNALTIRAWDGTSGTNGGTADTGTNGGATAFSAVAELVSIQVITYPHAVVALVGSASAWSPFGFFSSALTVNRPAATLPNDVLVAAITVTPSAVSITPPSGWVFIRRDDNTNATSSSLFIYYRIAGASEPASYTWFLPSNHAGAAGGILAFRNVDTSTPVEVQAGGITPSALAHSAPSILPITNGSMLVTFHEYGSSGSWTPPFGMTEAIDLASQAAGDPGISLSGNYELRPLGGSTGTRTATAIGNADMGAAMSLALRAQLVTNAAPVLEPAQNPVLANVAEDAAAPVGVVGTLISSLVDFATPAGEVDNVTDADAGALLGIAITAADASQGTWFLSMNAGSSWFPMGPVSSSSARVLYADANTRIYMQPTANFSGTISSAITFRAWDRVGFAGNANLVSTIPNGGTTAFSSATDVIPITVTPVNDAPVLNPAASLALAAVAEDALAPVGPVGTLVGALVDFASPAGQVDNVTEVDPGALLGIAITAADASNGTWFYTTDGSFWNAMGAMSNANARLLFADGVARVYFQPNTNFNGTVPSALTFRAWDRTMGFNGATANTTPNGGTTAFSLATDDASITVNPVNDAPSLNTLASPVLAAVLEDAVAPSGAVGTLVSALVDFASPAGQVDNVNDPDAGALLGIAVTAVNTAAGSCFYSTNNGSIWNPMGAVSASSARLLAADPNTRLYFQPSLNVNGTIPNAITFRALDRTSGTPGALANTTTNGGTTAFSSATDDASISVTPVNDAPVLNNAPFPTLGAVIEDTGAPVGPVGTLVSALVDFASPAGQVDNVTDVDAGAQLGIAITQTSGASQGSWFFSLNNGSTWDPVGAVSTSSALLLAADASTRVYLQPAENFSGTLAFTFRAWDRTSGTNGALANTSPGGGTTAFSTAADGASLSVTAVNDAPVLNPTASPVLNPENEDVGAPSSAVGTSVNALVDFASSAGPLHNVTDVEIGPYAGVAITGADVSNGAWFYSTNGGSNWSALGAVSDASARLLTANGNSRLYFRPNANFNGTLSSAITFRAWDQSSGTNGSLVDASVHGGITAFSSATDMAPITVNPVNDAPILNTAASPELDPVNEDSGAPVGAVGTLVSALADLGAPAGQLDNVSEVDADAVAGIAITDADAANGSWFYSTDDGAVWNPIGAMSNSTARLLAADANTRLHFQPNPDFNGTITGALTFRAWDQTSGTNGSVTDVSTNGGATAFSTATDLASLTITAVNDAPVNSVPGAQTTVQNVDLVFSTGNGNSISVSDADVGAADVEVTLMAGHGVLTLGSITGLVFTTGSGMADAHMTFSGTLADVNSALSFITFSPTNGYSGPAIMQIITDDLGNTGAENELDLDVVAISITPPFIVVSPRLILEGPYDPATSLMSDALRNAGLVPITEPYAAMGYLPVGGGGGTTTSAAVLATTGNDAPIDWVIIELRDPDNFAVVASRCALLQRDGDVVDVDGSSPVQFDLPSGNYHMAVRHRNHLGAMTLNSYALSSTPTVVDITTVPTYGTDTRKSIGGAIPVLALWAGDVNFDGQIKYTGAGNDRDPILIAVGSTTPNNTAAGYAGADVNMDGTIKYTGAGNDRDPILVNIGSTTPNAVRLEQWP